MDSRIDTHRSEESRVALCNVPATPVRPVAANVSGRRESLIRMTEKKWVNGTVLHYSFLDHPNPWRGDNQQKDAVRSAFAAWKDLGIGLQFKEVQDPVEAEIRIGFDASDGSWSYVGRDNVDFATNPTERTMNFGWDLTTPYGRDTALHEIGHAIGFPHEHQNPRAGIVWDEPAVLRYFAGPPNSWPESTVRHNILRKLSPGETEGSPWDVNSIMHYRFPAGLIVRPERYRSEPLIPESGLSSIDINEARRFYPPLEPKPPELRPWESQRIRIGPGAQLDFQVRVDRSRDYTIQTFGQLDTVMILFEEIGNEPRFVDGDDDSGTHYNAKITTRLVRERKYFLRVRLYSAFRTGEGALMMF